MNKTSFLFPGQGAQTIGMGLDIYQEYGIVREVFDMAEELCKINLSKLCFNGPMEDLTKTVNLQPAITAVNLSLLAVIEKEGVSFDVTAGHSLGEYAALKAAGVVSGEDVCRLVKVRGELMNREAERFKGAMSAVVGLSYETVEALSEQVSSQVSGEGKGIGIANHNAETQIVVSGDPESIGEMSILVKENKGRALPLKVSGAWHSPLIKGAEVEFRNYLSDVAFKTPEKPLVFNVSAETASEPDEMKENMAMQLCRPVRWYDTINHLTENSVGTFVEIGPGKVLCGLLKKVLPKDYPCKIYNVNDMKSLEVFFKDVI